ncbi:MAG TPA: hypothetical protein VN947_11085 [Polyangia bacterium]|nr:hypothetical protein [Polyangia bacterium]
MKILVIGFALVAAGCASGGGAGGGGHHAEHVAPAPAQSGAADGESMGGGGEASGPEHQPEVVHSGKAWALSYDQATARYKKGERCGGADAPDMVMGQPDQHNEMQVGRDKVVTYGYRFPEGTLLIRCRADHVEVTRTLK